MVGPPVAEIIRFTPKESYLASAHGALRDFFKILASTNGFISAYHGLQIEETESGKGGFIVILWETLEHHQALQKDADKYSELRTAIDGAADNRSMLHVFPKTDPSSGFTADALEIAIITLKAGHTKADIDEPMDVLSAQKTPGIVGSPTWGQVHEEKEKVGLFVGWSSKEAHMNARNQPTEAISGAFGKIAPHMAGVDMKHVKLEKYSLDTVI
ncbi:hypothetical protein BDN67DRAFT_1010631 [Paxillus ammoniavirescens]|nr:hypothetical protein BDN67DRAFT_1010631 [Paxillus ammoniavirescens]